MKDLFLGNQEDACMNSATGLHKGIENKGIHNSCQNNGLVGSQVLMTDGLSSMGAYFTVRR